MERYEKMGGIFQGVFAVCLDCGSVVYNETKHDEFHAALAATAQTARAADDTAGMFRPIGGSGTGGNQDEVVWFKDEPKWSGEYFGDWR